MRKLLCLFLLVIVFIFLPKTILAADKAGSSVIPGKTGPGTNWAEQNLPSYQNVVNKELGLTGDTPEMGGEAYNLFQLNSTALGITRGIVGTGITTSGNTTGYNGGAIGMIADLTGAMYDNRPASTGQYVQYLASNMGLPFDAVKPVYAAGGIGFTGLNPILELWKVVRNLSYLVFALIFIVIGLMIMLRVKIDPKTVVSVQNALPKIFLALILITFSYPIAGFLIDLMYLLIGVILSIFSQIPGMNITQFQANLQSKSIFEFVGANFFGGMVIGSGDTFASLINSLLGNGILGNIFSPIGGAIGALIVAVAILYALFKTWLMLLGAYINIIIGVILSPLAMVLEAIPGQSGFSTWLRSMLSNLLQFPLVIILLLFGGGLIQMAGNSSGFVPGNNFVPPLIGGSNAGVIPGLIGLGILLLIPKAGAMLQDFLKTPPFKYGTAWQEAMGFGSQPAQYVGKAGAREGLERVKTFGAGTMVGRIADVGIAAGRKSKWWTE